MPIMKPAKMAASTYLRYLFTKTEKALIDEILRKRNQGYVDYAETAALRRIQDDLQHMVDESWEYVPQMIETRFYGHPGAAEGYANAASIAGSTNSVMMETLVDNLLGEITEAATRAAGTASKLYTIARMDDDELRKAALSSTAYAEALGKGAYYSSKMIEAAIRNHGVTAFVDKAGRNWSLSDYCNMAARTTARQAEVAGVLSKDDHDLYQIVKHASSCPVCAPLQGRVYSKSGTSPYYPPLALAFGKIDPAGSDDLSNTYLNIHPNCLCTLLPFTEAGKSEKELQKIREFSSPETNPLSQDPRSKAQIEAYREKERNRARLLREKRKEQEKRFEKQQKQAIIKSDLLNQESSEARPPKGYEHNFDDFKALNLTAEERDIFSQLKDKASVSGFEHGVMIEPRKQWKIKHSDNYNAVELPDADITLPGTKLYHSHTGMTPPSAADMRRLVNPLVDEIGVVTSNGDVFTVSADNPWRPKFEDFNEVEKEIRKAVDSDIELLAIENHWTYEEFEYVAIREELYRLSAYYGWTVRGGIL